ncbi:putative pentatricopeptide repeat-containing protein At1g43010 [Brassica rapa]|uniref:Pentacotripeptide-repeat region of PRORP domain-containing protein n=1 Tax=Brassica campestris TaxID=3711 RepID=M4EVN0_BRACM|nr:putative pentatricopeptide repeat-containing protein At1g43010 [Brassica rapa]
MMQSLGQYSKRFLSFRKTQAIIQFTRTLKSAKLNDTLRSRVMAVENRFPFLWRVKVTPVLNEWLKQGNEINPTDLRAVIKALCESQRFDYALQVSEWITKRGVFEISTEDVASRLYLIEIHSGLSEAENFFKSIPENMKDDLVYTTLLSFYTKDKETRHEAEATYQKMREKNLLFKPNPYYKMISLYGLLGETNMVDEILRQMIENGVQHDITLTSNNVLKAYASVPDVEAMEKFLKRIEYETPPFALAWQTGISMAKAYLKCGSNRKAIEMLRRTEQVVDAKSKDAANKVLMEMYGEAGAKRDEARLYISQNAKQRQRKGACRCKGSGGRSSHHPGYYYGGCGGGCGSIRGGGDGSRADDNGGGDGTRADDNGGGVGADNDGDGGGGCGGGCGGCGSWD